MVGDNMHELRRLVFYNPIAYFSFLLYLLLGLHDQTMQNRIFIIFIPIILLFLTMVIFRTKSNPQLKKIISYSIPDFIVRLISLELCVVGSVFCQSRLGLTIVLSLLIVLFAINLTLEKIMSIRMNRYVDTKENSIVISRGRSQVLVSLGVSYVETILLLFMLLFPYNITSSMSISTYFIWGSLLVILMLLYVRQTLHTLYGFYKKEKDVRYFFVIENAGVYALLIMLSLYGYCLGFSTFADGVFYITSMLLLLPRQIFRRKRLLGYNEFRGGRNV